MQSLIDLIKMWAVDLLRNDGSGTKIYLFGSIVQDGGYQFDINSSDIDLITVISDNHSIADRVLMLKRMLGPLQNLEIAVMQNLQRRYADKPVVSNVIITKTEADYSIHKSGDRKLLSFKRFKDLLSEDNKLCAISRGEDESAFIGQNSDQLAIIRFCQENRNKFISVSPNGSRIFRHYDGEDAVPKATMRNAAILSWNIGNVGDDRREDLIAGMTFIQDKLNALPSDIELYKQTVDVINQRRSGRGQKRVLSEEALLVLNEILFDEAVNQLRPSMRKRIDILISSLGDTLQKSSGPTSS